MRKKLALVLALAMTVSIIATGCGTKEKASDNTNTATPTVAASNDNGSSDSTVAKIDWTGYNDLIKQIKASTDFKQREALMHQAEDALMNTGALVPIYYYNDIYMQKAAVTGIYSNLFGFKFFMYANAPSTTLRINLASEPDKLDPALNSSVDGACLAVNSFVGLYTYDEKGALEPALADKTEVSADGKTYTITLKDGLKWSDGSDLSAKDFEYSWKRAAATATGADYSYMFNGIEGYPDNLNVKASDDGKTLTVVLTAPTAYFYDLLAFPAYYPVKQSAVEGAAGYSENPGAWATEAGFVTNGAYTLKSWKHNESMVYEKNPYFYNADKVKVTELDLMLSADDTAIYAAYNADNLDFIDTVPTDEIASLLNNPEFHIVDNLGTYYVCFNVNSPMFAGKTVEQAVAMRKAISLLIDRDYIAENIGQTGQKPASAFIPEGMADGQGGVFKQNDADYTYPDKDNTGYYNPHYSDANLQQAKQLLESAGYKFGDDGILSSDTPLDIKYITNDGTGHVAIAQAIQQDLAAVGINMTIQTEDWNVFLEERKAGQFDVARDGWIADFNDPINMLEMWTTESGNNDAQFGK